MSLQAMMRLSKDLKYFEKDDYKESFGVGPIEDTNLFLWSAVFPGPEKSLYERGLFELKIKFPKDYPFEPPEVTFETKVYHPNIHLNGEISIGILTYDWEPKIKLIDVLKTIQRILAEPEEKSFLNFDAAIQYKENKDAFIQKAKEWTQKYAIN